MGDFQLIVLSDVIRPVRKVRESAPFTLVQFPTMAAPEQEPGQVTQIAPQWLLPGDALARVQAVIENRTDAIETILERLKAGLIKATYETFSLENTSRKYAINSNFIPQGLWQHYPRAAASDRVWDTSDLRLFVGAALTGNMMEDNVYLTFFQVRIGSDGIDAVIANSPRAKPAAPWNNAIAIPAYPSVTVSAPVASVEPIATPPTNKGGAPRKAWWDDFWIEICRQIYDNELKVEKQADLERAMLDWASANGHDMSETSAKVAARKLFKAWKLGDKN
jgi:hypothetical protein